MARIDVSELMLDPDFVSSFTIIERTPTINNFGENVLEESAPIAAVGSVQSPGKETLKRLPDGVSITNIKTVYIKRSLKADATGVYSDQVVWEGKRYNVISCLPWSNFGAGWYEVDIEMENKTK